MIELCLNLSESRELDVELLADVIDLLFYRRENDGSSWRRSCGAAQAPASTLSTLAPLATFSALAAFSALAGPSLCTLWDVRANGFRTHSVRFYTADAVPA